MAKRRRSKRSLLQGDRGGIRKRLLQENNIGANRGKKSSKIVVEEKGEGERRKIVE